MTSTLSFSLEIKALKDRQFEGYGAVFGNVDLGGDLIARGAFAVTLAQHRKSGTLPLMFWMHRPDQVAGVWLDMKEDKKGLYVKGELADTQLGNEIRTLLGMYALRGLSIGFRTVDADYNEDGVRILKELELVEVSVVSLAMNPIAKVESVKSRLSGSGEYVPEGKEFERLLRDAGCSRKVATIITSRLADIEPSCAMLDEVHQSDSGDVDEEKEAQRLLARMQRSRQGMYAQAIHNSFRRGTFK
jgi:hypothetical protein